MAKTRLSIAADDICELFDGHAKRVFRRRDLSEMLERYRDFWRLAQSTNVRRFIEFLEDKGHLRCHRLQFPKRAELLYVWREATSFELAQALRPEAYFSHYSAVSLHGLTEQSPRRLYLNEEQTAKPRPTGELEQGRINAAFKRKPRVSNNLAELGDGTICLLSGKYTGSLAVEEVSGSSGERLRVTNLERTLIDIAVRPFYAGGVFEVLGAYGAAADRTSVAKLVDLLRMLGHIYPYHQAIGFYMEQSGAFTESFIKTLREFAPVEFDFFLTYGMGETDYSERWRLFYPKGL